MGTSGNEPTPKLVLNVVVVHAAIDDEIFPLILNGETQVIDMPMRVCHPSGSKGHVEVWLGYHKEPRVWVIPKSVSGIICLHTGKESRQHGFRVANQRQSFV